MDADARAARRAGERSERWQELMGVDRGGAVTGAETCAEALRRTARAATEDWLEQREAETS